MQEKWWNSEVPDLANKLAYLFFNQPMVDDWDDREDPDIYDQDDF